MGPQFKVVNNGLRIPNQGLILGDHRIYLGCKEVR